MENNGKVLNLKVKTKKRFKRRHILFSIIVIYIICFFTYQAFQIISLKNQEKAQMDKLQMLQETKENYQQQLDQVSSPEYIEKIARENLRMIKPGEKLYVNLADEESENGFDEEKVEEE